ncbi:MAG: hypothetical protein M1832_001176 [Thelocarpon impressellum]|nr:MAG: hypothetical protein M1832_001176 [Thelocarpon impressellum]
MASKRASLLPAGPKPPCTIHPTAIIADTAVLSGTFPVTIGANAVLHPRAKLLSTYGPVSVGAWCVIGERCVVGLSSPPSASKDIGGKVGEEGVVVEDATTLEPGAVVEAKRVGQGSVIDVRARLNPGSSVGAKCKIGPLCVVAEGESVPDRTVVYHDGGAGMRRRRRGRGGGEGEERVEALRLEAGRRHVEVLRRLIPTQIAKWQT